MSNKAPQNATSNVDQAAILAALSTPGSAQDRLATLLERQLTEEYGEKQKSKDLEEKARRANLESIRATDAKIEAQKDACPHMKPNFTPAIGGQKDHQGNFHFVCQYCNKEFGNNLPYHLKISADMVGGPQ